MSDDWPRRFKHFALAVDYVDEGIVDEIKELLHRYFSDTLDACFFRFLTEGPGTETPSGVLPTLETVWSSSDQKLGDVAMFASGGKSSGLLALAYEQRKPLWVTAPGGGLMVDAKELEDGWSRMKDLPPYHDYGEQDTRTAIVLPLHYGDLLFGVMDLEFADAIPITRKGKKVVRLIADAIGRIVWLHTMTERQRHDTREAFNALEQSYREGTSPLRRHTVFVASSARADEAVMAAILDTLGQFQDVLDVKYWKVETASGSIAEQVRAAISEAEFGVCYISEPADEASMYRFLDNPNVLFEAGMLQMLHELRDDRAEIVSRWIPVREGPDVSPPLPFDFAGDRVIIVPRDGGDGDVDGDSFAETLRSTVHQVIEDLEIA